MKFNTIQRSSSFTDGNHHLKKRSRCSARGKKRATSKTIILSQNRCPTNFGLGVPLRSYWVSHYVHIRCPTTFIFGVPLRLYSVSHYVHNTQGRIILGFNPAVSRKAAKAIRETIRGWGLTRLSPNSMEHIASLINATVRGWIDYYGAFFRSKLKQFLMSMNIHLIRWMMRKYKRYRGHWRRSWRWLEKYARQNSGLFVHWDFLYGPPLFNSKRLYGKSRVS